jgi:cytochrome c oxidase subunit 3
MNISMNNPQQTHRIHPHKFTLWMAIGSICMMFAGLTSAYIVKRDQDNFLEFDLPAIFWFSTIVIVLSSVTMHLALKSFKAKERNRFKLFITITALLGVAFAAMQTAGFFNLENHGIPLIGYKSNAAASFILVILGVHALHVLGGVVALVYLFIKAFSKKVISYNSTPLEIMSTYWHFVDILWIYLLIFLIWLR